MLEADTATDLSADLAADLGLITDAALAGGEIAMRHFRRNPEVWMKSGNSPVSEADLAVDEFLRATLMAARPDYGWLSEETADTAERLAADRSFIVDPIDGTRAFIDGRDTWCVSVAVVEAGQPIAGVLACPVTGELFQATRGGPATLDGRPIRVRVAGQAPQIAGPKPMVDRARRIFPGLGTVSYVPSLAYRVAMVAAGRIDATFVKPNAHDWDLAAADLILKQAGGGILTPAGEAPRYGGADPRHGSLVAGSTFLLEKLSGVLAETAD